MAKLTVKEIRDRGRRIVEFAERVHRSHPAMFNRLFG